MDIIHSGKNSRYQITNRIASVPEADALAGTITVTGTIVRGTGTDFSQIEEGEFLLDATHGELRKVVANYALGIDLSGASAVQRIDIDSPFSNAVNNQALRRVKTKTIVHRSVFNASDVDGKIDGVPFAAGNLSVLTNKGGLEPCVVDATGSVFDIEIAQ